jgi:hypothetical protein
MTAQQLFPTLLIAMNLAACISSLVAGDAARTVYWLAAGALNASITYPLPRLPWGH